jgi:hypothetical protein
VKAEQHLIISIRIEDICLRFLSSLFFAHKHSSPSLGFPFPQYAAAQSLSHTGGIDWAH